MRASMNPQQNSERWHSHSSKFALANILNRSVSSPAPCSTLYPCDRISKQSIMRLSNNTVSMSRSPERSTAQGLATPSKHRLPTRKLYSEIDSSSSSASSSFPSIDDDQHGHNEDGCTGIRGGRWDVDEHERFLKGFRLYGHKWKRVQQIVQTRSVTQVRTHAQKYLLRLSKTRNDRTRSGASLVINDSSYDGNGSDDMHTNSFGDSMEPIDSRDDSPVLKKSVTRWNDIAEAANTLCYLMRQEQ
uniref:Uncharacterized protein AlNc14C2G230 n=1 Tax=Albugo laibachii Nc14 TaxID=890382 RepID=F0VZ89_9STRA|nr:conserved hypothetical protein [Albugo laibachii Nc14]|eukprot:CCA14119.1 conserved hypothetical protein [Albugo laibachii Nc14]